MRDGRLAAAEVVKVGKNNLEEANVSQVAAGDDMPQEVTSREGVVWKFALLSWSKWAPIRSIDDDEAVLTMKTLVHLHVESPTDAQQKRWRSPASTSGREGCMLAATETTIEGSRHEVSQHWMK